MENITQLLLNPFAMMAKTQEVSEKYQSFLEAQAEMFDALATYSRASLELQKAMTTTGDPE